MRREEGGILSVISKNDDLEGEGTLTSKLAAELRIS